MRSISEPSKQTPQQNTPSQAVSEVEPLMMSGSKPKPKNNSPHAEREKRARELAAAWQGTITEFVRAHYTEIIQVREDFLHKAKSKTIHGCKTWEQYVEERLGCSPQHMRRLLAGDNPATAIHDGSENRKPTVVTATPPQDDTGVPPNCPAASADLLAGTEHEAPEDETPEPEPAKEMTKAEYTEALIGPRLEKLASVVARKSLMDLIPGKFFVYGAGGMDKRNGQALREELELKIEESLPTVYEAIIRVAQRQLAALPPMPVRVPTCPKCGNQREGTLEPHSLAQGVHLYRCQNCGHKASTRKFNLLPPVQQPSIEAPAQSGLVQPKQRGRMKKPTSPAGMVHIDECPPEVRERILKQVAAAEAAAA